MLYAFWFSPEKCAEALTKQGINKAVARLRTFDPESAATEAYEYAKDCLNRGASQNAALDQAQLWMLTVGLYFSAANCESNETGFVTLQAITEERYRKFLSEPSPQAIFTPLVRYPQRLQDYLAALSMLPQEVVAKSLGAFRALLAEAG
jgi:hypothetical protein